jgi:hypothetical protein
MEIRHHIGFNTSRIPKLEKLVNRFSIDHERSELPGSGGALITFQISETSDLWSDIHSLIEKHGATDRVETFFSDEEILNAEYLRMIVRFETGFPEPRDTWVTNPINYKDYCSSCGTFEQTSSFQIRAEPNLRTFNFMTFAWADAIFCRHFVIQEFRAEGIDDFETVPVLNLKTHNNSEKIVQIKPIKRTSPGLITPKDMKVHECAVCGEIKYSYHLRGIMQYKRSAISSGADMLETHEWFGVGSRRASREVFVSNQFARLAINQNWKSLRFKVIELVD